MENGLRENRTSRKEESEWAHQRASEAAEEARLSQRCEYLEAHIRHLEALDAQVSN
jgi:hypothetical protein